MLDLRKLFSLPLLTYTLLTLPSQAEPFTRSHVSEAIQQENSKSDGEAKVVSISRSFYSLPKLGVESAVTEVELQIGNELVPKDLIKVRYNEDLLKRNCEKINIENDDSVQNLRCKLFLDPKFVSLARPISIPVLGSEIEVSLKKINNNVYEPIGKNWFTYTLEKLIFDEQVFNLHLTGLVEDVFTDDLFSQSLVNGRHGYNVQGVSVFISSKFRMPPRLPKPQESIMDLARRGDMISIFCRATEKSLSTLNNKNQIDCSLNGGSEYYVRNLANNKIKKQVNLAPKSLPVVCAVMQCFDSEH